MEAARGRIGVLFVCTGNICRSPTAHAVFRHQVEQGGLAGRFRIDSAGTHGYHTGDPPDDRAVRAAQARGVSMADLRARKVESGDFDGFDYIFSMDSGHYKILAGLGGAAAEGRLFHFLPGGGDVPDPYYGQPADFDRVFAMVERACGRWLDAIRLKHGL